MISNTRFWLLIALLALVYIAGLFVALMENDSAQFAVMAKRMVVENDFLSLIKGTQDYLDKPHLHYWLSAISFILFGFEEWAYRIPALLATALGAYSCFGLGSLLYTKPVGKLAALIFLSAQTIILSNIDVRTDAVLTGLTIFAIWQLTEYLRHGTLIHIILGAIGAGLAFSTKGQIAILVIGIPLLVYMAYNREFKKLWNWKIALGLAVFIITITPVLLAYYQQFDLHPEKIIRGRNGRSGVLFILWEQSFERLSGEGMGKNSSDYFFFFHSFLWVFLPWTILGLLAYAKNLKIFVKEGRKQLTEVLTLGGITIIFLIISFAQFKLPHYLNIVIPLFAVLTAAYVGELHNKGNTNRLKLLLKFQWGIAILVLLVINLIGFYVFKIDSVWGYIIIGIGNTILLSGFFLKDKTVPKLITLSVLSAMVLNLVLNLHFYPSLLKYQGGSELAKIIEESNIPEKSIYKLGSRHTWALDFVNSTPVIESRISELRRIDRPWVVVTNEELKELRAAGLDWDMQFTVDHFRITRLQLKFLNPNTRETLLENMHLVRLR